MRRRAFIEGIAAAAAAWPLRARAQQPATPIVGFLSGRALSESLPLVRAFQQGLSEGGYVEGRSVSVEYRWAEGQYDRLQAMAADLVERHAAVIVTTGGTASAMAVKRASATIPIVFNVTEDPIKIGLVTSLNRPGGNATGVANLSADLAPKRLGLLQDAVPQVRVFAMLVNPEDPAAEVMTRETEQAARASGRQLVVLKASKETEIDSVFANLEQRRPIALLVIPEPFFITRREQIVALAARHAIPTMYGLREFAEVGGLMSYGINPADGYRQIGNIAANILKGANPADMPVLRPTKFDLVINLKTAKALDLTLQPGLIAIADEVIE
jgi:putative ABC transport system substrate-binding protein